MRKCQCVRAWSRCPGSPLQGRRGRYLSISRRLHDARSRGNVEGIAGAARDALESGGKKGRVQSQLATGLSVARPAALQDYTCCQSMNSPLHSRIDEGVDNACLTCERFVNPPKV